MHDVGFLQAHKQFCVDTFSDTTVTHMDDSENHIDICWAREFIISTAAALINYLQFHRNVFT